MKKLYYSIGEVSKITGVKPHILRYWESLFNELSPSKNKSGKRVYKEQDIQVIIRLRELIQKNKYSTDGAKNVLKEQKKTLSDDPEKKEAPPLSPELTKDLAEIRFFLEDLLKKIG